MVKEAAILPERRFPLEYEKGFGMLLPHFNQDERHYQAASSKSASQ